MDKKLPVSDLKAYISDLVPAYMVPNFFVFLDKLPLTSNGKVDRKKLLSMEVNVEKKKKYVAPRNDFEKAFQEVAEKVLGIDNIGIDDSIIDLGADSLTLMKITIELLERNYILNIQDIYELKTIREISDKMFSDKAPKEKENEKEIQNNVYYKFNEDFSEQKISEKNVLLTGSTGYLGIHILNELLKRTDANIYCIIRKKNSEPVTERLKEKLSFYFGDELLKYLGNRIQVVEGDISLPKFGLKDSEYENLGKQLM